MAITRTKLSNILIGSAAGLTIVTGILHLMFTATITSAARNSGSNDVQAIMPALWITVGCHLIATGVIVGLVALENSSGGRYVLAAAALVPWSTAIIQAIFIGSDAAVPMTFLTADGTLLLVATYYREGRKRRSSG